jgi:hypothetical protein
MELPQWNCHNGIAGILLFILMADKEYNNCVKKHINKNEDYIHNRS